MLAQPTELFGDRRNDGGVIIDVETDEIVCDGLSMPHSPRWHNGKLWVLNAGTGYLGWVDFETKKFVPFTFCPGFLRGLAINGNNMTVKAEAEYLVRQAKTAYINSLKLDNSHWDAKHNLDRVLGMLPSTPTPGVGDGEKAGLIMGNVPVGLP